MGAILSIQSHVVFGHVGNSAAVFALQRLGREVWPVHTVQFSSHAGYPGFRGETFSPGLIGDCVAGLDALGVLGGCAGVLTGYLGRAETGEAALAALAVVRAKNPEAAYACDPVIGDEGRVYVREGVAEFFRDRAIPLATLVSPNAYELSWLTGRAVSTRAEALAALAALRARGPEVAYATSLRLEDTPADALDMIVSTAQGAWRVRTPRLPLAVNGAGDLISALFLHECCRTATRRRRWPRRRAGLCGGGGDRRSRRARACADSGAGPTRRSAPRVRARTLVRLHGSPLLHAGRVHRPSVRGQPARRGS